MKNAPHSVSQTYWRAFSASASLRPEEFSDEANETLRYRCLMGFIALEAEMNLRFQELFGLEWAETVSYLKALLSEPALVAPWIERSQGAFTRAQWFATLRFLANTNDPQDFSPSLADMGVLLTVLSTNGEVSAESLVLFRAQKLRNAVFHWGRPFSELEARETLKLLTAGQEKWGHETIGPAPPIVVDRKAA